MNNPTIQPVKEESKIPSTTPTQTAPAIPGAPAVKTPEQEKVIPIGEKTPETPGKTV